MLLVLPLVAQKQHICEQGIVNYIKDKNFEMLL